MMITDLFDLEHLKCNRDYLEKRFVELYYELFVKQNRDPGFFIEFEIITDFYKKRPEEYARLLLEAYSRFSEDERQLLK